MSTSKVIFEDEQYFHIGKIRIYPGFLNEGDLPLLHYIKKMGGSVPLAQIRSNWSTQITKIEAQIQSLRERNLVCIGGFSSSSNDNWHMVILTNYGEIAYLELTGVDIDGYFKNKQEYEKKLLDALEKSSEASLNDDETDFNSDSEIEVNPNV